jgi:hypothetical protein
MTTHSMNKFRAGLFAAIVAGAPLSSQAQDPGMIGRMDVPFSFETGAKHFAPGVYTIRMQNAHALLIRGLSTSGLALASIEDNGVAAKAGKAVFQRYGNRYFLQEVQIAGKSRHLPLPPTKKQDQLETASQRNMPGPVETALLTEH